MHRRCLETLQAVGSSTAFRVTDTEVEDIPTQGARRAADTERMLTDTSHTIRPTSRARFMRKAAPLAIAVAVTLTGCASPAPAATPKSLSTPKPAPTIDAEPATGMEVVGDGYSYSVPEGWGDNGFDASAFGADTFVFKLDDADDFIDNINVVKSLTPLRNADAIEGAAKAELESSDQVTDVAVRDQVTVAGSEAVHLSATFSVEGSTYLTEQYFLTHGTAAWVVTFSFSTDVSEADRKSVTDPVLASWSWQ